MGVVFTHPTLRGGASVLFLSGTPSGTHDQLGLVVDDLEGAIAELRSNGLAFEDYPGVTRKGVATLGPRKAAWFKGSEGNLLSLSEPSENPAMPMVSPGEE